jgi:shikimate dehydrogenase
VAGRKAAVLGSPIAHSLSPVLHRAAYAELGLTDWSYEAIECDASGLPGLLDSLGPQWAGLSLTMPLKRAVLPLLDVSEPLVDHVGVANTVVFADGERRGYNTDVPGIVTALREAQASAGAQARDDHALDGNERSVATARGTLILGGGATACSALAAMRADVAAPTVVAVRDEANAGPLLEVASRLGAEVRLTRFGADPPWQRWQLVISTVPAGAADQVADQVEAGAVVAGTVLDVVYQPWPTRLAAAAEQAGARVISGFELLLHQAALQVKLMTGVDAPTAAMRAAGQAELARRQVA